MERVRSAALSAKNKFRLATSEGRYSCCPIHAFTRSCWGAHFWYVLEYKDHSEVNGLLVTAHEISATPNPKVNPAGVLPAAADLTP